MENLDEQIQDQESQEQGSEEKAENRKVTWNITFKIARDVTTRYKFVLDGTNLKHGKWKQPPANQIVVPEGRDEFTVTFISTGRKGTALGTEGWFTYRCDDSTANPTTYKFEWKVPWGSEQSSCMLTGGSSNYDVKEDLNQGGKEVTGNVTITQVKPTI